MKTDDLIELLARQPEVMPRISPMRELVLALSGGVVVAFALMVLLLGLRPDLETAVASPLFQQKIACLALLLATSVAAAHLSGIPGRHIGGIEGLRWIVPIWLVIATTSSLLASRDEPLAMFHSPTILRCLVTIPFLSVIPSMAMIWVIRRAAPISAERSADAIGWAAGATGALAYAFHCQADQPAYLLIWYGLAIALTVVVTRLIATRWLHW